MLPHLDQNITYLENNSPGVALCLGVSMETPLTNYDETFRGHMFAYISWRTISI